MHWSCDSHSVEQTRELGMRLAQCVQPGDVIGLDGDLGAGKTHFVQGLVEALGVDRDAVTSPTFTLIQEYPTRIPVCHFDAYRLRDSDEFLELGVDELLGGDVVCVIEWASRVADVLPRNRLQVNIVVTSESAWQFSWTATGPRGEQLLSRLMTATQ